MSKERYRAAEGWEPGCSSIHTGVTYIPSLSEESFEVLLLKASSLFSTVPLSDIKARTTLLLLHLFLCLFHFLR